MENVDWRIHRKRNGKIIRMQECDLTDKQVAILKYLREHANSRRFFKGTDIAKELGLTPRTVGTNLFVIGQICPEFDISVWSRSRSTVWRIVLKQQI